MTTWTPATSQSETWESRDPPFFRVFSPLVFALHPVFDTGQAGGYWPVKTKQSETWTAKAAP
jgi:hypothetical protein